MRDSLGIFHLSCQIWKSFTSVFLPFQNEASLSPRARAPAAAGIPGLPDARGRWVSLGGHLFHAPLQYAFTRGDEWTHACPAKGSTVVRVRFVFGVCLDAGLCVKGRGKAVIIIA